jgi:HlyD family secretion protein
MNKKVIPVILILVIVIGGAIFYQSSSTAAAAKDSTLYGNVDIREVSLAFRVGGRVIDIKVDEGSVVKAGDSLATLDTEPLQNSLKSIEATLAAITARNTLMHNGYRNEDVSQAKAAVSSAKIGLAEAERQYKRQHDLVASNSATQQTLDTSQSQRDQAAAQLTIAEEKLRAMNSGFRKEEVDESDAQLNQAKANVDVAALSLRDAILIAPSDGIVISRAIEKGSMIQA